MLFHKSIISFVAAIILATSVAAAATPAPQLTGTGNPNQGSSNAPSCNPGSNPTCCASLTHFFTLSDGDQASLKALHSNLDPTLPVGDQCSAAGDQACADAQVPLCCDPIQSLDDLPNVSVNCVNAAT
ncbi:hypothetical protein V8E53_013547 [Lactarius tabidus]